MYIKLLAEFYERQMVLSVGAKLEWPGLVQGARNKEGARGSRDSIDTGKGGYQQ